MFVGRKKELDELVGFLTSDKTRSALIYGKRRVGKTTLVQKALEISGCENIWFEASDSDYSINLGLFVDTVSTVTGIPLGSYNSFKDVFLLLKSVVKEEKIIVIDEFQYILQGTDRGLVESEFKQIIDGLPDNLKVILTGSYVVTMKEIIMEGRPMFSRFQSLIDLKELDYREARAFYPNVSLYDAIQYYAVFGGSPFVLENIDSSLSLEDNIKKLILAPTGVVRTYIEYVLFKEVNKAGPLNNILKALGNGKLRYSELESSLNLSSNGLLSKRLNVLLEMDLVTMEKPINKKEDPKKTFYYINDNVVRFYYAYIFANKSRLLAIGPELFYASMVTPSLMTFVSYRYEAMVRVYLRLKATHEMDSTVLDIGTYWYDDPKSRKNGEFDCVVQHKRHYSVYEVKYYANRMSLADQIEEADKIRQIPDMGKVKIGFVAANGFEETDDDYEYITAEDMYS